MTHLIRNIFTIHWCVGRHKHRRFSRLNFAKVNLAHCIALSVLRSQREVVLSDVPAGSPIRQVKYDTISESQWLPRPTPTRTLNGCVLGQVVNNHALCSFISTVETNTLLVIARSANSTREFCFKVCSLYNLMPLPP